MFATAADALVGVERVIGAAVFLQTVELWQARRLAADDGVWSWPVLRGELAVFPRPLAALLDRLLAYPSFLAVLLARALAALAVLVVPHVAVMAVLLLSTVLIIVRWRGTFNGGSDFMTLVVLSALTVARAFPGHPLVGVGALWYVALQACHSYFLAGLVKLRTASWRRGAALAGFLRTGIYAPPRLPAAGPLTALAGWVVILFECAFPLALFDARLCVGLVGVAFTFHLGNVYVFGLNRFLFAWLATYPALLYCSQVGLPALLR